MNFCLTVRTVCSLLIPNSLPLQFINIFRMNYSSVFRWGGRRTEKHWYVHCVFLCIAGGLRGHWLKPGMYVRDRKTETVENCEICDSYFSSTLTLHLTSPLTPDVWMFPYIKQFWDTDWVFYNLTSDPTS